MNKEPKTDSLKNQSENFNENFTHNKNKMTINGKIYNACYGCELWNRHHCTADRSYEFNGESHRIICDKHMAHQYWKVYHVLFYRTQECEQKDKELKELKRQYKISCLDCEYKNTKADVNRYLKALMEIAEVWAKDKDGDYDFVKWQIFNIINKVKDGKDET